MDETKPRKPWWLTKRWWLALAAWLPLAYLAGLGPAWYVLGRGFDPYGLVRAYQTPSRCFNRYLRWWQELGFRHQLRERDRAFVPDPTVNRTRWTPPKAPDTAP